MSATDTNDDGDGFVSNGFRGGALTSRERDRIDCLTRRLQHLEARIKRRLVAGLREDQVNFDRQEASALRWAIEAITGKPVSL
jgi:hypothetical protein